mmetsp:Transcript_87744/g.131574  ORF Transcript_87744/g.131574 Transcript_87744/m.131574 type:complete len:230 (+) Transcript_87744:385-1074(+)
MTVASRPLSSGWLLRPCSLTRRPAGKLSGVDVAELTALRFGLSSLLLSDIPAIRSDGSPSHSCVSVSVSVHVEPNCCGAGRKSSASSSHVAQPPARATQRGAPCSSGCAGLHSLTPPPPLAHTTSSIRSHHLHLHRRLARRNPKATALGARTSGAAPTKHDDALLPCERSIRRSSRRWRRNPMLETTSVQLRSLVSPWHPRLRHRRLHLGPAPRRHVQQIHGVVRVRPA